MIDVGDLEVSKTGWVSFPHRTSNRTNWQAKNFASGVDIELTNIKKFKVSS